RDTQGTIQEAHRLWDQINRPNLMVKIPGTVEGVGAIRQCLVDGLNINVTLLFAVERYAAVAEAYLDAIETRLVRGQSVEPVASVASFFVSRVDTIVDKAIRAKLQTIQNGVTRTILEKLEGKIGVANARLAYQHFTRVFNPADARWDKLAGARARVQRPLWASTSMKAAGRRDTLYLEELIAPNVVITAPLATLDAFRDHGQVRGDTAAAEVGVAQDEVNSLAEVGIDFPELLIQLENEGVASFADSWQRLMKAVEDKARRFKSAA
ncbi:MAG TPA: transaldolase family protein, partial [Chloroflexota bacterium]|nr:transaldolase family protein [Chloroflexota bacterium]